MIPGCPLYNGLEAIARRRSNPGFVLPLSLKRYKELLYMVGSHDGILRMPTYDKPDGADVYEALIAENTTDEEKKALSDEGKVVVDELGRVIDNE